MKIGIIGGHRIPNLIKNSESILVETSYGNVDIEVSFYKDHTLFFLNRHGKDADIPPHNINYLANIQALAASHVECIFSVGTVGSLKPTIQPGDFIIPHDFIDFTKSRVYTFFEKKRVHVDMTDPYCPIIRKELIAANKDNKKTYLHKNGVYLATEGPRLETAAEITLFSKYADIVGMTAVPEIVLAREKGICYASLCVVCNMAAGLQNRLTTDEITTIYKKKEPLISELLRKSLATLPSKSTCHCKDIVVKATL